MRGMCRGGETLTTGAHCTAGSLMPLDSSRDRKVGCSAGQNAGGHQLEES